jgi:hypothetical protein
MLEDYKLVFKSGYKYYTGKFINGKLKKGKEYKTLAEIPKFDKYLTFRRYLKFHKIKDVDPEQFMGNLNISSLYVFDKSEEVQSTIESNNLEPIDESASDKAWEKKWWKTKNPFCLGCEKKCKQSVYIKIVSCPFYKKK